MEDADCRPRDGLNDRGRPAGSIPAGKDLFPAGNKSIRVSPDNITAAGSQSKTGGYLRRLADSENDGIRRQDVLRAFERINTELAIAVKLKRFYFKALDAASAPPSPRILVRCASCG